MLFTKTGIPYAFFVLYLTNQNVSLNTTFHINEFNYQKCFMNDLQEKFFLNFWLKIKIMLDFYIIVTVAVAVRAEELQSCHTPKNV